MVRGRTGTRNSLYPENTANAASAKKAWATMASKISKTDTGETVIQMADVAARLSKRRAELGEPKIPRNAGKSRTPSKRALLAEIEKLGGKW